MDLPRSTWTPWGNVDDIIARYTSPQNNADSSAIRPVTPEVSPRSMVHVTRRRSSTPDPYRSRNCRHESPHNQSAKQKLDTMTSTSYRADFLGSISSDSALGSSEGSDQEDRIKTAKSFTDATKSLMEFQKSSLILDQLVSKYGISRRHLGQSSFTPQGPVLATNSFGLTRSNSGSNEGEELRRTSAQLNNLAARYSHRRRTDSPIRQISTLQGTEANHPTSNTTGSASGPVLNGTFPDNFRSGIRALQQELEDTGLAIDRLASKYQSPSRMRSSSVGPVLQSVSSDNSLSVINVRENSNDSVTERGSSDLITPSSTGNIQPPDFAMWSEPDPPTQEVPCRPTNPRNSSLDTRTLNSEKLKSPKCKRRSDAKRNNGKPPKGNLGTSQRSPRSNKKRQSQRKQENELSLVIQPPCAPPVRERRRSLSPQENEVRTEHVSRRMRSSKRRSAPQTVSQPQTNCIPDVANNQSVVSSQLIGSPQEIVPSQNVVQPQDIVPSQNPNSVSLSLNDLPTQPTQEPVSRIPDTVRHITRWASTSLLELQATTDLDLVPTRDVSEPRQNAPNLRTRAASLSNLVDISTEENTLSTLRKGLDNQFTQNAQLQHQLAQNRPLSTDSDTEGITLCKPPDFIAQWKQEKALREAEDKNKILEKKLKDAEEVVDETRKHFRKVNDELRQQLNETIASRDSILELREKESSGQESLIGKLQTTVQQLQDAHKSLEQANSEMTGSLDTYQQSQFVLQTAQNQIKDLLANVEKKRGKPFYENEPVQKQSSTMLVHTVERCIQDLEVESDLNKNKVKQLETELEMVKTESQTFRQNISRDHQQKIISMAEENERQLSAAAERSISARKQAQILQEQFDVLQDQSAHQLRMKNDHIHDLETQLSTIKEEYSLQQKTWSEKKSGFEKSLDDVQSELNSVLADMQTVNSDLSTMKNKYADSQLQLEKIQMELDYERDHAKKAMDIEDELMKKINSLEKEVDTKEIQCVKLEAAIENMKQESDLNIKAQIAQCEKNEMEKAIEQSDILRQSLNHVTEKYNQANLELELSRAELSNMKEKMAKFSDTLDQTRIQMETAIGEKENLTALLNDRVRDNERLLKERDYYIDLLEQRNKELDEIKDKTEKLILQLEEKSVNLDSVQKEAQNIAQIAELNSRNHDALKDEKERLSQLMTDKTVEMEELRAARDNNIRKLKIREKRLKEIESERHEAVEELRACKIEFETIKTEKNNLFEELKESRYEVAFLTDERDTLKKALEGKEGDSDKQIKKLMDKFRASERDLKLAKKALQKKEESGGKAIKVAGKMQKEVTTKRSQLDQLKSKIYWLEECLESISKEKKVLEEENEKLASLASTSTTQNETLTKELEEYMSKCQELRSLNSKLESGLEKAAVKNATSQGELERLEQDMARLKLKHQLEMKEIQRNGSLSKRVMNPITVSHYEPSKPTPVYRAQVLQTQAEQPLALDHVQSDTGAVGEDLRKLVSEMRSLWSQTTQMIKTDPYSGEQNNDYELETDVPNPIRASSPLYASSIVSGGRLSPVADLLSPRGPVEDESDIDSYQMPTKLSKTYSGPVSKSLTATMATDAQQLCQRLEEKIQNLTRIGGHLQQENRETAALIKDQDRRIKQVKMSEKNILKR